jgi:hypothetical protein
MYTIENEYTVDAFGNMVHAGLPRSMSTDAGSKETDVAEVRLNNNIVKSDCRNSDGSLSHDASMWTVAEAQWKSIRKRMQTSDI